LEGNIKIYDNEYNRFRYKPLKRKLNLRKTLYYVIIFAIIITVLTIFWWWPSWFADIDLQAQLYYNKGGQLNFYEIQFLNFWSTSFIINKTALIGGLIGVIIMNLPPDRTFLTVIGTKLGFGRPSMLKASLFWFSFGFVFFYFIGFTLNANEGAFAWTSYLLERGQLQISPSILTDVFNVILNVNNKDYVTVFLYSNVVLLIIYFILGILIFRAILNVIRNSYLRRNDYYVLANIIIIIGLAFGMWFFTIPITPLDGIGLIQAWSILFGFAGFLSLGALIYFIGRIKYMRDKRSYFFHRKELKRYALGFLLVFIFLLIPLFISLGPVLSLNNTEVWLQQEWYKKINREIEWTKDCAGLSMFDARPIENFTKSSTTPDAVMISQIRQFDQDFAVQYLAASIGSTFEGLADSDIIYINNKEYWVAPKTVRFSEITGDAVQTNTELYDHVEGFLAMDTFSGNLVNVTAAFNISANYPIFFGETESEKYLEQALGYVYEEVIGAYDSDILLGTQWAEGIPNNKYRYEGQPDGVLTGLEGFWKTLNIGLFAYAFQAEHKYLINRNVKTRVERALLPQLKIDYDPYLVFDMARGKMYYAVSIYTFINVGSYARYPVLRFLGVCLVDVLDGRLSFYKNHNLNINDPTYPLWKIYLSEYDWQDPPNWLKEQIRYPEDLFETQLRANYIYHVKNPSTWRRGDDFYERPEGGDLFYIETDVGEGIEYVGIDLVEYKGQTATLLAGMYVIRHGEHLGEALFYYTSGSEKTLIGPRTARETYESEATQEISLIAGARNGNILLYPLADSIYFYIPTYSTAGSLQQLKLAGLVEAFTRKVGYGANAQEAYNNLNITSGPSVSNISLSYNLEIETSMTYPDQPANFKITLQNQDTNYSAPGLNVKVNLTIYSSTSNDLEYTIIVPPYLYPIANHTYNFTSGSTSYTAVNFTIISTTLYFGEGLILNGYLNTSKGNVIIYARWTLIVNDKVIYQSIENIILVLE